MKSIRSNLRMNLAALAVLTITNIGTLNTAWAVGGQDGGGGNAIVCRDKLSNKITRVELLDFREGKIKNKFDLIETSETDELKIARGIISRLAVSSPVRAQMYIKQLNAFANETAFIAADVLEPVEDSFHIFTPASTANESCIVQQAAVQIDPRFPGDLRYYIQEDVWNAMSPINKAGLMVHEVIYREARANGAKDSRAARYLNSLLFTKNAYQTILPAKDDLVKSIEFYLKALNLSFREISGVAFENINQSAPIAIRSETTQQLPPGGVLKEFRYVIKNLTRVYEVSSHITFGLKADIYYDENLQCKDTGFEIWLYTSGVMIISGECPEPEVKK